MGLNRAQLAQIYRPAGAKPISIGNAWTSGGSLPLAAGSIDLSLPIRGLRFVFKGRLVIGGATITSPNPEGYLNLIPNISLSGINKRQGGNVTLWNGSLASLWMWRHAFSLGRSDYFDINGTIQGVPTTPFPTYITATASTYDWRIVVDLPFYPFGAPEGVRPGFLVRDEEFASSLQLFLTYGQVTNAAVAGALGTGAAGTTYVFSSFGSGAGSPTVDIYSLPLLMGGELKDQVIPGFLSRAVSPISTVLQSAGSNVLLTNLQKQPTTRIFAKVGVGSTVAGQTYFTSLSDTNLTQLGLVIGGTRNVRIKEDIFAHKNEQVDAYGRDPIQGLQVLDFMSSGNPDAAYNGGAVGEGTNLALTGDVTGVANAVAEIMQEQMPWSPTGALYNY